MSKSARLAEITESKEELSVLRAKRFDDAVHLRQPDAIPVIVPFSNLLSELENCTKRELYDDPDGGMPVSLLWGGTLTEIEEQTKRLCRDVGRNGGFVMFPSIGELQGCKWNLIKAWVDCTRKYGIY